MKYTIDYIDRPKDDPEYQPIDFDVLDEDNEAVAWAWGTSKADIEVECNHPEVEYGSDEETGTCPVCGADCLWHYEELEDGTKDRVVDSWSVPFVVENSVIEKEVDNDYYKNM